MSLLAVALSVGLVEPCTVFKATNDGRTLVGNNEDWEDVQLSLVSGRPVSFTQNLYEPLYTHRPDVPVHVQAAAAPRVFEGAMMEEAEKMALEAEMVRRPRRPPVRPAVKTGTLNVNAVPVWAWVYIDGHKQPRPTPLYNIKLKAGRHRIRLENPRLKLSVTRQVNILPGKKLDLVVEMKK